MKENPLKGFTWNHRGPRTEHFWCPHTVIFGWFSTETASSWRGARRSIQNLPSEGNRETGAQNKRREYGHLGDPQRPRRARGKQSSTCKASPQCSDCQGTEQEASKITLDNIKYFVIYLPRQIQELYEHTYKTLSSQLKQDLNNWKNIDCSWVG